MVYNNSLTSDVWGLLVKSVSCVSLSLRLKWQICVYFIILRLPYFFVFPNVLPVLKWVRGEPLSQDHWLDLFRLVGLPRGTTLEKLTFGNILDVRDSIINNSTQLKVRLSHIYKDLDSVQLSSMVCSKESQKFKFCVMFYHFGSCFTIEFCGVWDCDEEQESKILILFSMSSLKGIAKKLLFELPHMLITWYCIVKSHMYTKYNIRVGQEKR